MQRRGAHSNQIRARGSPGHCLHGVQFQTVRKQTETHPEVGGGEDGLKKAKTNKGRDMENQIEGVCSEKIGREGGRESGGVWGGVWSCLCVEN